MEVEATVREAIEGLLTVVTVKEFPFSGNVPEPVTDAPLASLAVTSEAAATEKLTVFPAFTPDAVSIWSHNCFVWPAAILRPKPEKPITPFVIDWYWKRTFPSSTKYAPEMLLSDNT